MSIGTLEVIFVFGCLLALLSLIFAIAIIVRAFRRGLTPGTIPMLLTSAAFGILGCGLARSILGQFANI